MNNKSELDSFREMLVRAGVQYNTIPRSDSCCHLVDCIVRVENSPRKYGRTRSVSYWAFDVEGKLVEVSHWDNVI